MADIQTKNRSSSSSCPDCEIGPFTRNHYFTGKLLVERDFRQEQAYYIDKLRLHQQKLHGSGVVCGLKVTQHDNPACRSRFVCIEPGLALDCCGHDILVMERDCIDITACDPIKTLIKKNDTAKHRLQICIRYKECPTEPIPVLYDDCGCDDTQCAPNRILESYEVGVILDPKPSSLSPGQPGLAWNNSIAVAHASQVVLNEASRRVYVLTADASGSVAQFSETNNSLITSNSLGAPGLAMAVSSVGDRVYVVTAGAAAGDPRQLRVLDATKPGLPPIQAAPLPIAGSENSSILLAVLNTPDIRLMALIVSSGALLGWKPDIDSSATPANPTTLVTLAANQNAMVLSTDASILYTSGGGALQQVTLASMTIAPIAVLPAGAAPSSLAIAANSSGDLLAAADQTNSALYLVNPSTPSLLGSVKLDHPPVALAVAPGGRWGYVSELDAGKSFLEPVDLGSLQLGQSAMPGNALPVGANSGTPVITELGSLIYLPYTGDLANATDGGVAIINVSETACCSLIWKSLDGCPDCDTGDCIVLATIENYVAGDSFEDQTDPPADPAADANNQMVRIDNRTGRKLLPSTSTLAEIVECICKTAKGGQGTQGPQGLQGNPGLGIDQVAATFVTCDQLGSAQIAEVGGQRTLELVIPGCCDKDFAHIIAMNWTHAGTLSINSLRDPGLIIGFDRDFNSADIKQPGVVQVLMQATVQGLTVWGQVPVKLLQAVRLNPIATPPGLDLTSFPAAGATANGIRIIAVLPDLPGSTNPVLQVVVDGDFITGNDSKGVIRAADLNHLPPYVSARPTGDGIEGGTFVSWLTVKREQ